MSRSEELFAAVDRFNAVHDAWAEDMNSPHPTLAYWHSFDQLLAAFNGDMPANCRPLATAVFRLAAERAKFDASGDEHPHQNFFGAREELVKVFEQVKSPAERRHRETIKELDRQKVPHEQIARIWGLRRPDGTGKAYLVQQELNEPGSVIGPNYVHPDDAQDMQDMQSARRKYLELAAMVAQEQQEQAIEEEKPCPESPKELWLLGVSTQQAAKMLKRDQSEVARMWEVFEQQKHPVVTAEAPEGISPLSAELVPAVEGNQEPVEPISAESADPLADDIPSYDPREEFADWTDDDLKEEAKRLGVSLRGPFNREKAIDKILDAEVKAEA